MNVSTVDQIYHYTTNSYYYDKKLQYHVRVLHINFSIALVLLRPTIDVWHMLNSNSIPDNFLV